MLHENHNMSKNTIQKVLAHVENYLITFYHKKEQTKWFSDTVHSQFSYEFSLFVYLSINWK